MTAQDDAQTPESPLSGDTLVDSPDRKTSPSSLDDSPIPFQIQKKVNKYNLGSDSEEALDPYDLESTCPQPLSTEEDEDYCSGISLGTNPDAYHGNINTDEIVREAIIKNDSVWDGVVDGIKEDYNKTTYEMKRSLRSAKARNRDAERQHAKAINEKDALLQSQETLLQQARKEAADLQTENATLLSSKNNLNATLHAANHTIRQLQTQLHTEHQIAIQTQSQAHQFQQTALNTIRTHEQTISAYETTLAAQSQQIYLLQDEILIQGDSARSVINQTIQQSGSWCEIYADLSARLFARTRAVEERLAAHGEVMNGEDDGVLVDQARELLGMDFLPVRELGVVAVSTLSGRIVEEDVEEAAAERGGENAAGTMSTGGNTSLETPSTAPADPAYQDPSSSSSNPRNSFRPPSSSGSDSEAQTGPSVSRRRNTETEEFSTKQETLPTEPERKHQDVTHQDSNISTDTPTPFSTRQNHQGRRHEQEQQQPKADRDPNSPSQPPPEKPLSKTQKRREERKRAKARAGEKNVEYIRDLI